MLCVAVCLQDVDFDSQSQSSYDRVLSERGHSQMSSDDTWKGKSNASEYTAFTSTHTCAKTHIYTCSRRQILLENLFDHGEKKDIIQIVSDQFKSWKLID